MTSGKVMNLPASPGHVFRIGISDSLMSLPVWITSLQGAPRLSMTFGKKEPISASMGSIFNLSSKPEGICGFSRVSIRPAILSSESVSRASRMRRSLPNWFISTRAPGWPFTFSKSSAGPPASAVPRPIFATRSAISAISRFGSTSTRIRFSSPLLSSRAIHSRRSRYAMCKGPLCTKVARLDGSAAQTETPRHLNGVFQQIMFRGEVMRRVPLGSKRGYC